MQSDLVVTDGNLPDAIIMVSQEVKTAIADLERDLEVQQSLKDLQKHFALGNAQLRYQTLTQHFQAIFARNPGASGSAMTSIWRLEDTVTEHHKQLVDNKLAKDPSTGSEAPPSSSDRGSDASHQIHELVHLYNLDSEITSAMHEWIHLGSIDMKDQMERLMEAEAWTPVAPQQRIAACGVEMQRIINASLDVWLEHTLSGSTQRKENVGKAMIDSLVSVLSAYATTFSQPFKSSQDSRLIVAKLSTRLQEEEVFSVTSFFQPKLNMSGRVSVSGASPQGNSPSSDVFTLNRAASVRDSAGVYDSPRGLTPQQSFNRNSRGTKKPLVSGRTLAFVKSLSIGYHKSYKSVDTVQSPHEKHAIIQLLEVEQGICLTELMCIVANTLDKLVQDARELGKNLRLALEDDEEEIAQREKSGTRPIRLSIEIPEGPEDRPSASRLNSSPLRTVKTAKPKGKSRKPKKAAFAVDEDRTSRHSPRLTPRALMGFRGSVTTNVMERDRIVAEVKRGMKEERRKEKKQKKVYTPGSRKFNKAVKSVRIHRKQTSLSSTISGGSSTPETSSSDKASSDDSDSHSDSYDTHAFQNNKNPSFMDDASLASESYESFQAQQSKGESLSMKAVYNNALFMADPLGGSGRGSSGSNKKASWGKYFPPASIGNSPRGGRTSWNSRGHSKVSSTHSKSNQPDSLLTLDPSTCGASPRQSDQEHLRDMSMQASPYTQGGQRKTMWSSFSNSLAGRQKPRADGPASSHQVELEVPEELPPPPKISFVETAWQELSIHLEEVVTSIQMSYAVQYRDTLLALLILAFGKKPEDETSVKVLSDILTAIHDELVMMGNNMADEERRKVLASMVEASWQAALATLNLLVLNQAGFRPLGEVEAETTRQFLTSLQDMYNEFGEEREPEGSTAPEQRMMSAMSCSAILQAMTASTQDLQDMYMAQFSCLQEAVSLDNVRIERSPQQVSLVDILRLLRQRRKTDQLANTFVQDQIKVANAVVTQVIFGLSSLERVKAEAKCCLGVSKITGRLYITQNTLCYTTILDSDLKLMTDTSIIIALDKISNITRGTDINDSLVITTTTFEMYTFSAFPSYERDRVLAMFSKGNTPVAASLTESGTDGFSPKAMPSFGGIGSKSMSMRGVQSENGVGNRNFLHSMSLTRGSSSGNAPSPLSLNTVRGGHGHSRLGNMSGPSPTVNSPSYAPYLSLTDNTTSEDRTSNRTSAGTSLGGERRHPSLLSVKSSVSRVMSPHQSPAVQGIADGMQSTQSRPLSIESIVTPSSWHESHVHNTPCVMSVPCHLAGTIRNRQGTLIVFLKHIEFATSQGHLLFSFSLEDVELISQRNTYMGGNLLSIKVGGQTSSYLFGGMTDALLASLKQSISDLCFR